MTAFTISDLTIPKTIDAPDAADFVEMARVRNDVEADVVGNYDLAYTPAELLPGWLDPYLLKRMVVARADGRIAGRGVYELGAAGDAPEAWVTVEVLREFRGHGLGGLLFDRLVEIAREDKRTILQGYGLTSAAEAAGNGGGNIGGNIDTERAARLTAPTGFGSVPLDSPGVQFALSRGFTLEQVDRFSRLALPVDPRMLAARLAEAEAGAGGEYSVVRWEGRTPERWLADIALLGTRMSTDAPSAGLEITEDVWDADRVRAQDDREAASPRVMLVAAALHVASGHLAGYTELSVPREQSRPVSQEDTLVLREHRGHRLGMLLKVANIIQLEDTHPGHPSITTFNAEENRHMLSVNEAVGFVPVGYEGAWRRAL